MAAESNDPCQLLADQIAELLCSQIHAGSDVIEYIDSTYGNTDVEEIKAFIEEPGSSERETLLELIFFPNEPIQVRIEQVLEKHSFTSEDVATIAAELENRNLLASVALGDTGRALNVRLDRRVIDPFLTRLNITYTPDAVLHRTVAEVFAADTRRAVRVRLRNARNQPTGSGGEFLLRYIRAMGHDPFFFEGLDFLLAFLQEIGRDADVFEAMMKKKRRYWWLLNQTAGAEEKLRKSNVEILLLQGERTPYIDKDRTQKTIAAIDRICLAVFGKTEPVEVMHTSTSDWEIRSAEDAAAMIRRLFS
jgi:hypothetical protein